jgi:NADH:ubiquinone oxidoreductase subunit C
MKKQPTTNSQAFKRNAAAPQMKTTTINSTRRVQTAASSTSDVSTSLDKQDQTVPELIKFLKEDLQHLFDDIGIDQSKYEDNVVFSDPITKHSSLRGYLLNIDFLKKVFDPTFKLLDIRQTGPYEITTRWSMVMKPTFVVSAVEKFWNPVLTFTGTSIMGVNPATGKFSSHSDTWDAVGNQQFFSFEAFTHMLSQVSDLRRIPVGLESPPYTVVLKKSNYEVRKYDPFVVAEAPYGSSGPAAFGALAGYIFGRNAQGAKMAMTTPVLSTAGNSMQFYLGKKTAAATNAPQPLDPSVNVKEESGGLFVVSTFNGFGDESQAAVKAAELRRLAQLDGIPLVPGATWVLARYNDPGTPAPFRRNDVMFPVDESKFELWEFNAKL